MTRLHWNEDTPRQWSRVVRKARAKWVRGLRKRLVRIAGLAWRTRPAPPGSIDALVYHALGEGVKLPRSLRSYEIRDPYLQVARRAEARANPQSPPPCNGEACGGWCAVHFPRT